MASTAANSVLRFSIQAFSYSNQVSWLPIYARSGFLTLIIRNHPDKQAQKSPASSRALRGNVERYFACSTM